MSSRHVPGDMRPGSGTMAFESACRAPFVSMFLDPHGDVLACCQNTTHPLGNVAEAGLLEIWRGPAAEQLRRALRDQDLGLGCGYCSWTLGHSTRASTMAAHYDGWPVPDPNPE